MLYWSATTIYIVIHNNHKLVQKFLNDKNAKQKSKQMLTGTHYI